MEFYWSAVLGLQRGFGLTEWFEWRDAPKGDFAVIGNPIHHSKSPAMHHAAYRSAGRDLIYRAIRVQPEEFPQAAKALRDKGYRGLNVTLPLKTLAYEWGQKNGGTDNYSQKSKSSNCLDLVKGFAHNTDVAGFCHPIKSLRISSALILGAGGAAKSAAVGLLNLRIPTKIWARSPEKSKAIIAELDMEIECVAEIQAERYDLVVNATSAGINGSCLPIDWRGKGLAYDLAYGESAATFLNLAKDAGWSVLDGSVMLAEQGALSYEIWGLGEAPREAMMEALR